MSELTQAEYARRRGITRQSVSQAVREGRLATVRRGSKLLVVCSDEDFTATTPTATATTAPTPAIATPPPPPPPVPRGVVEIVAGMYPGFADLPAGHRNLLVEHYLIATSQKRVTTAAATACARNLKVLDPARWSERPEAKSFSPADYAVAMREWFGPEEK